MCDEAKAIANEHRYYYSRPHSKEEKKEQKLEWKKRLKEKKIKERRKKKKGRGAASCVTETVLAGESEVVLPVDEEDVVTKRRRVDLVCDTEKQLLQLQESGIKEERQNNAPKNDASLIKCQRAFERKEIGVSVSKTTKTRDFQLQYPESIWKNKHS